MFKIWQKALIISLLSWTSMLSAKDAATSKSSKPEAPKADVEAPKAASEAPAAFEVSDLPREDAIDGQLGGPNAPALDALREKMAKSMLEKGICNESFYGEEFCRKAQEKAQTFKVPDSTGEVATEGKAKL